MRKLLLIVAATAAAGCSDAGVKSAAEQVARSTAALTADISAPVLAAKAGTLCFRGGNTNFLTSGPDAGGWMQPGFLPGTGFGVTGEAMLGGSTFHYYEPDVGLWYLYFVADAEFRVKNRPDVLINGPKQVCAEIVQNECNFDRACWQATGHWKVERKENPGKTNSADCLGSPAVIEQDTPATQLPPLADFSSTNHTYRIVYSMGENQDGFNSFGAFEIDGVNVRYFGQSGPSASYPVAGTKGFAAIRYDGLETTFRLRSADATRTSFGATQWEEETIGGMGRPTCSYTSEAAGIAPDLSNFPGRLCFDRLGVITPTVTLAADGWMTVSKAQSRAVLGGTAVRRVTSPVGIIEHHAQSDVEFQVTNASPSIDIRLNGPRRQVCAELGAAHRCAVDLACWHGNGDWSIERISDDDVPVELCRVQSKYGENAKVLASNGGTARLPALVAGSSVYRIVAQSNQTALQVQFIKDGVVASTQTLPGEGTRAAAGFAGYRADRIQVKVRPHGSGPTGATVDATEVVREGAQPWLSSTYDYKRVAVRPAALQGFTVQTNDQAVLAMTHGAAPNGDLFSLRLFRDGYRATKQVSAPIPWNFAPWNLNPNFPGGTFTYQVGYLQDGVLSNLASLVVTRPAAGVDPVFGQPTTAADEAGKLSVAVILMRTTDARGPDPYPLSAASDGAFGPGYSLREYLRSVSRNAADLSGSVFADAGNNNQWISATGIDMADHCLSRTSTPLGPMWGGGCGGSSYNGQLLVERLRVVAAQRGVPVSSYEKLIFVLYGMRDVGYGSSVGTLVGGPTSSGVTLRDAGPLRTIVHETLGHGLNLWHSGDWDCPDGGAGPSLRDLTEGGCAPSRYGDGYDPMGGGSTAIHQFHTMNLYSKGWLSDAEVVQDPGRGSLATTEYRIYALAAASDRVKQVRIPIDANSFYFLEFRTDGGFNSPPPGYPDPEDTTGVYLRLWWNFAPGDTTGEDGGSTPVTYLAGPPRPLRPGDTFCDKYRGIKVEVVAHATADSSDVRVTNGTCTP